MQNRLKRVFVLFISLVLILSVSHISVSAEGYSSYQERVDQSRSYMVKQRPVFNPDRTINGQSLNIRSFSSLIDICVQNGKIYLLDSGNSRIVVLNSDYSLDRIIDDLTYKNEKVSLEEASAFLEFNEKAAVSVSTGVMLCILSPVLLILLGGLAEAEKISLSEDIAGMMGVVILLLIVAGAVAMFLMTSLRGKQYEFLENMDIDTAYGVSGMAKERRAEYAEKHSRLLIVGIMLCVVAAVPMLILAMTKYTNNTDVLPIVGVDAMLITIAIGVKMIVLTCIRHDGYDKLLEEGDYTRLNKRAGKYDGIYWAIALAVYLGWSFVTNRWEFTWIVWPIAGVLYVAYHEIMKAIFRSRA